MYTPSEKSQEILPLLFFYRVTRKKTPKTGWRAKKPPISPLLTKHSQNGFWVFFCAPVFGGFFTRRFLGFFLRTDPPWRPAAPFSGPGNPSAPKMGVFLRAGFWGFFSAPPSPIRNWEFFCAPPCITQKSHPPA